MPTVIPDTTSSFSGLGDCSSGKSVLYLRLGFALSGVTGSTPVTVGMTHPSSY